MSLSEHYVLFRGIFLKSFILLKRYLLNSLVRIGTIYIFFLFMFFGGRQLSAQAMDDTLGGLIVGFFVFTMALTAYSGITQNVMREAQWGTLEQLYMSPFGIGRVIAVRTLVNVLWSTIWGGLLLALMLATTGESLSLDLSTVLPLGLVAVAPAVGIGLVLGGLALLYKRVEAIFQLMQFAFVGLIAAPVDRIPALAFLPMALGSHLLQRAMRRGETLGSMPASDLLLAVGVAALYLGLGYAVFTLCQRRARKLGVLGDY